MITKVEKVWGLEEWWVNEPEYCFKILVLKSGFCSSRHYHQKKKETFIVLKGSCFVRTFAPDGTVDRIYELGREDTLTINPGTPHEFWNRYGQEPCVIYEVSMHHDEDDVVRQSESHQL